MRALIFIARILLAAECLWFASAYIQDHTYERKVDRAAESREDAHDIYGIGIEKDGDGVFWFHSYTEEK